MAPPNSSPDHAQSIPIDEHEDTSSSLDDPTLQNATLSRQGSQQPGSIGDALGDYNFKEVLNILHSMGPSTSHRFSLVHTDSRCTVRTGVSVDSDHSVANDHSVAIEAELYMFLVNGRKDDILIMGVNLWELKSKEDSNSVLHIVAAAGQTQLIADILPVCKDVIKWKNTKGDLAFHCAAKAAQLGALKALIAWRNYDGEAGIRKELLKVANDEGNTALHIALENNQNEMAWCLVDEYPETCYQLNNKRESPLYLAVHSRDWRLVKHMIEYTKQHKPASDDALMQGKSVVHAAIEGRNVDILQGILEHHISLLEALDDEGQTVLSYAALRGNLELVRYLLKRFPESAYRCNKDGTLPIHKAVRGGHIKIIKELHTSKQLLNRKGQNIIHEAAASGQAKVLSYLLKLPELERLINLKDEDGNTPLHLATRGFHPRVVYTLTRERRAKRELQNKDGLTALDVAEIYAGPSPTFEARLTWMALRYVDAPRSSQSTRKSHFQKEKGKEYQANGNKKINDKSELESYKDRVDTHLLVATLVATVTFAAGFTAPGGYKQDNPDIGMAVLADKKPFQVFVLCNTAALYSSILSVVTLMGTHGGSKTNPGIA